MSLDLAQVERLVPKTLSGLRGKRRPARESRERSWGTLCARLEQVERLGHKTLSALGTTRSTRRQSSRISVWLRR